MKVVYSYGVAVCRKNMDRGGMTEILYIRKRFTYYFVEFVLGRYSCSNHKKLHKIFNNIAFNEKMDILMLDFDALWYKVFNETKDEIHARGDIGSYRMSRSKFEIINSIISKLIHGTENNDTLWEIPKGRQNICENELETAIRELHEETNITPEHYKIMDIAPISYSYIDANINYTTIYYIAKLVKPYEPKILFTSPQMSEIHNIRWFAPYDLTFTQMKISARNRLIKLSRTIVKKIKPFKEVEEQISPCYS